MPMKSIILLSITLFTLIGCQSKESTSTTNNTTNTNPSTDFCSQNNMLYGCPGWCAANPGSCESTTGGTSGTTGGSGGESNYVPIDNNWQALYQDSAIQNPQNFNCAAPTGNGYNLNRGTITIAGENTWYVPGGDTKFYNRTGKPLRSPDFNAFMSNTSYFLMTPSEAKNFYDHDGKLRVRFKIRPQPKPAVGQTWCYNRKTGQSQDNWGYTNLKFNVSLVGLNQNGSLKNLNGYPLFSKTLSTSANVGTCTSTLDFSGFNQAHPYGVVLVVHEVMSDQACWYNQSCTGYAYLKAGSCWQMDIEASVDGSKDI